jgi:hypothetical protein
VTFLATGILVGAVLDSHPKHAVCLAALEDARGRPHRFTARRAATSDQ